MPRAQALPPAKDARHILVVDDDRRLRHLLRKFLADQGYRVTLAADAAEARRTLAGLEFDLVILDVMMPGEDGFSLTRSLRATSRLPVLLLTAKGDAEDRIAGLEHGADDYLAKPFEPRELLLRVGAILRRVAPVGAESQEIRFGDCTFDASRAELRRAGKPVRLTTGEAECLRIFARNPGVTIPRAELGRQTNATSERSVDVQITRLRRKIEPDPKSPRYLRTVWGEGYVLWPE